MPDDLAVVVDEEVGGVGADAVVGEDGALVAAGAAAEGDGEGDVEVLDVLLDRLGLVAEVDGDDFEPLVLEPGVELLEVRGFGAAGAAAVEPEVDEDGLFARQ